MTQKEKAKAYDEALEQASKELKTCSSFDCYAARQIFRFFPELKESEDESTRKSIIHLLHVGGYMSPEEKDKAFAYLEKLKDIKILKWRSVDECSDIPDGHIVVVAYGPGCFALDVVYGGKILHPTSGELKATDVFYIPNTNENCGFIDKDNGQKEQKPETFNEPYNPDDYEVVIEGNATSLKRKEQKPSISCGHENDIEWSEEDRDTICDIIDHCITIPYIGGTLRLSDKRKKELKTIVKSLCSHPHWKPSEEQMRVLSKATPINLMPEELSVYISLYEELKKLI